MLVRLLCLLGAGSLLVVVAVAPSAAETSAAQQEANRQTVVAFYQKGLKMPIGPHAMGLTRRV